MGHFSDDKEFDEFMNASADEWSKPSTPPERPAPPVEATDRWGSPIQDKTTRDDPSRWGSEPTPAPKPRVSTEKPKVSSRWWIILIVILVVLCLCACLVVFGLPILGITLLPPNFLQF